jgi:hypothetical protein
VFETNSSLWGGVFNYIIPLFKTVPTRYKQEYQKQIAAKAMINGFIEAFQPDYMVETRAGQIREYGVNFPEKRSTSFDELLFFMDETSGWDLIEYWNYRALGVADRSTARATRATPKGILRGVHRGPPPRLSASVECLVYDLATMREIAILRRYAGICQDAGDSKS